MTWDLLRRSVTHGIVPGLAGGPWDWQRWAPASPWGVPPVAVMVLGWLALSAAVAISLARKQRIGPVWLAAFGYAIACQIPIYLMRSSKFTALELAQTLRYFPDLVFVLALLAAVGFCAPNRAGSGWLDASRARTVAVLALAVAFTASSLYSTATSSPVGGTIRRSPTCRTRSAGWPRPGRPRVPPCWTRRSTRWCCSGWWDRRTWPATCSR